MAVLSPYFSSGHVPFRGCRCSAATAVIKFSEQALYSVFRHAHVHLRACSDFPNLSLCVSGLGSFELVATGSNWKNSIS